VISNSFAWYDANRGQDCVRGLETLAINLSGSSLNDNGFLAFVKQEIENHRMPPELLCFEITETVAVANMQAARDFIGALRKLGCSFALDDFGSGLSSFVYLKNLPVDYLKIDGSIVRDIDKDAVNVAMVRSIQQLGRTLGMLTIAEYVESEAILQQLVEIGIDYAQGYAIERPVPLTAVQNAVRDSA
jgi:EAL domain-containing protein (putative c-di-GMP-specific phosphodiesterase class I)